MLWLKCDLRDRPMLMSAIQNRLEKICVANGAPPEMLLVAQEHEPGIVTLWLRLPDERYRTAFGEFSISDSDKLPKRAVLLVGHDSEFKRQFDIPE